MPRIARAARTIGSTVVWGLPPCPPRPKIVTSTESKEARKKTAWNPHFARRQRGLIVHRDREIGLREPSEQTVGQHGGCSTIDFLGRLANQHQGADYGERTDQR